MLFKHIDIKASETVTSIWASFLRPWGQLHATHCGTQRPQHLEPDCPAPCLGQVSLQVRDQMGPHNLGSRLRYTLNTPKDTEGIMRDL